MSEFRHYTTAELRERTPDSPPLEDQHGRKWRMRWWNYTSTRGGWIYDSGVICRWPSELSRRLLREVRP